MKLIDKLLQWVVAFFGIQTEDTTEPAPAEPAPATIKWLVPEQGFEAILDDLQGSIAKKYWAFASDFGAYAPTNPPLPISFGRRQIMLLPEPCAEVEGFNAYYATYNKALGVLACPKDTSFGRGVFYYVIPKEEIARARQMPDIAETYDRELRSIMEDKIHIARKHYPRVGEYIELLGHIGFIEGLSIGQAGSSPVVRFSRDDDVIGPDVKVSEQYGDKVSVGSWALEINPETGLWLHIADFEHDYRDEIHDFVYARRQAA